MTDSKCLIVLNIVGLTPSLLGEHTPNLNRLAGDGFVTEMKPVFPALTCSAQATMLTGKVPSDHGIVGNGWYFKDRAEIRLWQQPNWLIEGKKLWTTLSERVEDFSCAQLFWWYNMYAEVDYSITPRPIYPADGRKIPALYSSPKGLHEAVEDELGPFPFFNFWGPKADLKSSAWIAQCAKKVFDEQKPSLQLVYLPHLDYNLQRLGRSHPDIWQDVKAIDQVAGELIDHVRSHGAEVLVVSEYGIEDVQGDIAINRILRDHGYLAVREELGWEMLDCGASKAFALADHQIAHIYLQHPKDLQTVKQIVEKVPGVELVLDGATKPKWGIDHERAGDLIAVAEPGCWFSYYYWLDDNKAPDFAPTVDIHRKPGYDPAELFVDPDIVFPKAKAIFRVLQKKMGFRMLMDLIPIHAKQVKGSHGRLMSDPGEWPILIGSNRALATTDVSLADVHNLVLEHYFKQ